MNANGFKVSGHITVDAEKIGFLTYYSDGKISYCFDVEETDGTELIIGSNENVVQEGLNWSTKGIPKLNELNRKKCSLMRSAFLYFTGAKEYKYEGYYYPEFDARLRRRQSLPQDLINEAVIFKIANDIASVHIEDQEGFQDHILGHYGKLLLCERADVSSNVIYHYPSLVDGVYILETKKSDKSSFELMIEHTLPLQIEWYESSSL